MRGRRHRRRRPARRRFHALQLDVAFVAAVVCMLAAHVFRPLASGPEKAGPRPGDGGGKDGGGEAGSGAVLSMFAGEVAVDPLFEPDSAASSRGAAFRAPSVAPPPDLAFSEPLVPVPAPLPVRVAPAPPVPFPVSGPSFPPSPPLFSDPPPPVGPVAAPGAASPADVFVFRDSGRPFPVVFVDAPGVPAADVPGLEAAAIASASASPATSEVARLRLSPPAAAGDR